MDMLTLEHRLTETADLAAKNEERLNKMEKRQDDLDELVSTVKVLAVREENVEADVKEIKSDVKALTAKPAQRWEEIVKTAITCVVGALVGAVIALVLK